MLFGHEVASGLSLGATAILDATQPAGQAPKTVPATRAACYWPGRMLS